MRDPSSNTWFRQGGKEVTPQNEISWGTLTVWTKHFNNKRWWFISYYDFRMGSVTLFNGWWKYWAIHPPLWSEWGMTPSYRKMKTQGDSSHTMISEWDVTPPPLMGDENTGWFISRYDFRMWLPSSYKASKKFIPWKSSTTINEPGSLLDLSANAAGKRGYRYFWISTVYITEASYYSIMTQMGIKGNLMQKNKFKLLKIGILLGIFFLWKEPSKARPVITR